MLSALGVTILFSESPGGADEELALSLPLRDRMFEIIDQVLKMHRSAGANDTDVPLPLERGENLPVPTDTTHSMSAPGKI